MHLSQLHVKIGICSLNNDPLDFQKNYNNIMKSIQKCKDLGCKIRVGSQLQISGYGCHDHYQQYDTIYHSWDVVKDILESKITEGIVVDVGCPVIHKAALYNARVLMFDNKIIGIRPKMILADGDNYFQTRQFASWQSKRSVGTFKLPYSVQQVTGQTQVPIGIFIVDFNDTSMAYEICEQSWISNNPMIDAALDGAQIFINPSASDCTRGKLKEKYK